MLQMAKEIKGNNLNEKQKKVRPSKNIQLYVKDNKTDVFGNKTKFLKLPQIRTHLRKRRLS